MATVLCDVTNVQWTRFDRGCTVLGHITRLHSCRRQQAHTQWTKHSPCNIHTRGFDNLPSLSLLGRVKLNGTELHRSVRTVVGLLLSLAQWRGMQYWHIHHPDVNTAAFGRFLKTVMFSERSTDVLSALDAFATKRYTNRHFTLHCTYYITGVFDLHRGQSISQYSDLIRWCAWSSSGSSIHGTIQTTITVFSVLMAM